MTPEEIKRRYDQLFQERRGAFDQDADLIERYIAPIRGGKFFQEQDTEFEVQWRRPEVFDSTARTSAGILKAQIQGALMPADVKWFDLLFRDDDLNNDKEAKEWLESCGRRMWLAMEDSKFQLSSEECISDMVDFGNSVLIEEERTKNGEYDGLFFDAISMRGIYFEENWDGSILRLYRRLQWTPLQIMERFKDEQIPQAVRDRAEGEASMVRMDVIYCIYPRDDKAGAEFPASPKNRPWGAQYVLHEGAERIGDEDGFYEMPAFLARWGKTSGSKYGYGPSHLALPDVLTANNMVKQELAYVEKVIDPPSLVSERNIFGDLDLTAGGVNVVQDIDGIQPYLSGGDYGAAKMSLSELRERIEDTYFVNELQMKDSPAMTAYETAQRKEEILKMFGPMRSRFQAELFDPTLQRTFNIMYRNGQFLEPPESVAQLGGEIDVRYTGPMARAQRTDEVVSLERWTGFIANMSEVFPEMRDIPDPDEIALIAADNLNVPAKARRSQRDIDDTRKKRDEMAQAQAEAAIAQEQGAGMQAVAEGEQAMKAVQ
jgi:hypothetical protein